MFAGILLGLTLPVTVWAEARFDWSLQLGRFDEFFGGLSGIEVSADGTEITVVSDRGALYSAALVRDEGNVRVRNIVRLPFEDDRGRPLSGLDYDTEGLAFTTGGQRFLSTEKHARVLTIGPDGATRALPEAPDFAEMPVNGALEALAAGANGALFTLPERSGRFDQPFPVFRFSNGAWQVAFELARTDRFVPVGADFATDGRLYILMRDVGPLGFRSKVISVEPDGSDQRLVLETEMGEHGNLEGLAAWTDSTGAIRLLMVSDDNFAIWQRSELVEYLLTH